MFIYKMAFNVLKINMLYLKNKKNNTPKNLDYATEDSAIGGYAKEARHS